MRTGRPAVPAALADLDAAAGRGVRGAEQRGAVAADVDRGGDGDVHLVAAQHAGAAVRDVGEGVGGDGTDTEGDKARGEHRGTRCAFAHVRMMLRSKRKRGEETGVSRGAAAHEGTADDRTGAPEPHGHASGACDQGLVGREGRLVRGGADGRGHRAGGARKRRARRGRSPCPDVGQPWGQGAGDDATDRRTTVGVVGRRHGRPMLLDGMARPMGDGRPIDGNPGNLVHAKLARRPLGLGSLTRNRSRRGFPHGHRIVRGLRQDHLPHRHLARRLLRHGPDDPAHRFTLMDGRDRVPEHGRLRDDLGGAAGPSSACADCAAHPRSQPAISSPPRTSSRRTARRRRRDAAGR